MQNNSSPDRMLEYYCMDDLKSLNAYLPLKRKSLRKLMDESQPHVILRDGSAHFIRKNELQHLANIVDKEEEYDLLLLPMIFEIRSSEDRVIVKSETGIEGKIFSNILGMVITHEEKMITLFKVQLSILRKALKTTTQYIFIP